MLSPHIPDDLQHGVRVVVETRHGPIRGGRTNNGAAVFLEVPYALPPERFTDPQPLPGNYRYADRDYVYETKYCYQPSNHGQAKGIPPEDVNGFGRPSEDPLFVNIVSPSTFTRDSRFPVRVYIHGGFLQYGSPHELMSQAQHVAQERSEVWVNIGYRLSVFGFLACDEPKIDGNFGFKDQWLALLWIRDNIEAFGGDPANVRLTGVSAGSHSAHQILHHISHLPEGEHSPIRSAILESNAILTTPKTAAESRPQYEALCRALDLDPAAPTTLATLRDRSRVPAPKLLHVIETEAVGIAHATFRGCLDGTWLPTTPDPMVWQRTGALARGLRAKGVASIAVGDLVDEWYLYRLSHPVRGPHDVLAIALGYHPHAVAAGLVAVYEREKGPLPEDASVEAVARRLGEVLSDAQVYLPARLLARNLSDAGFPVVRYVVRWTPEQVRPQGYVTHATDRVLWALRLPVLTDTQREVAVAWLDAVDREFEIHERGEKSTRPLAQALTLREDRTIAWEVDERWDRDWNVITEILPGGVCNCPRFLTARSGV